MLEKLTALDKAFQAPGKALQYLMYATTFIQQRTGEPIQELAFMGGEVPCEGTADYRFQRVKQRLGLFVVREETPEGIESLAGRGFAN